MSIISILAAVLTVSLSVCSANHAVDNKGSVDDDTKKTADPEPDPQPPPVPVRTVNVPGDANTLAGALGLVNNGDTVEVAAGTYAEAITAKHNVTISGSGEVILDGNGKDAGLTIKAGVKVTLKDFKVQGADVCVDVKPGGTAIIKNSEIYDCVVAGIQVEAGVVQVSASSVSALVSEGGFGVVADASELKFTGTTITAANGAVGDQMADNPADSWGQNGGAGIFLMNGGSLVISETTISAGNGGEGGLSVNIPNSGGGQGGSGIFLTAGEFDVAVNESVVSGGVAGMSGPTISGLYTHNAALSGPALLLNDLEGSVTIDGSSFTGGAGQHAKYNDYAGDAGPGAEAVLVMGSELALNLASSIFTAGAGGNGTGGGWVAGRGGAGGQVFFAYDSTLSMVLENITMMAGSGGAGASAYFGVKPPGNGGNCWFGLAAPTPASAFDCTPGAGGVPGGASGSVAAGY